MKNQALFSSKDKSKKKIKCLLQFYLALLGLTIAKSKGKDCSVRRLVSLSRQKVNFIVNQSKTYNVKVISPTVFIICLSFKKHRLIQLLFPGNIKFIVYLSAITSCLCC